MKPLIVLFSLKGRLRRRDFWLWGVAVWLVYIGVIADGGASLPHIWLMTPGRGRLVAASAGLPIVAWISLALLTKRFHDRNRPMFSIVHALFPLRGWLWGVAECCGDGTPGPNFYGHSPKGIKAPADLF